MGFDKDNANGRRRARTAGPAVLLSKRKQQMEKRVWSYHRFARELAEAKRIGASEMNNDQLLSFCEGARGVYRRCFVDIRDYFIEAWERIERFDFPEVNNSKKQFCDRIGCSTRQAQKIVKGDVRDPNKGKTRERCGAANSPNLELPIGTPEDFAIECLDWVFRKLRPLRENEDPRYQETLRIMWPAIKEASEMKNPSTRTIRSAAAD